MWTRAATWTERAALALVILAVAGWLRFSGLNQTVARHVDEGLHLYETQKLLGVARALRQCVAYWRANPPDTVPRLDLQPAQRAHVEALANTGPDLQYARPLWNLQIAAMSRLTGFQPWVGNSTSALAGVLCVLALGLLAGRWCGTGPALCAMTFLALSPTHLWYSRTTFADVTGIFWLLAALWAYAGRRPLVAGLLYGAALATNPRSLHHVLIFLAAESCLKQEVPDSIRDSLRRGARFASGALVVPLACEALYHLILSAGAAGGVHLVRKTYAMSFAQLVVANRRILISGDIGRGALFEMAAGAEAPAVVALALSGLALALTRRAGFQAAAAAWLCALIVPLHLLTFPELRYSLIVVPFTCLLAGAAAWHLAGALPRVLALPALGLALVLGTVPQLVPRVPALTPRTGRGEPSMWSASPWPRLRDRLDLRAGRVVASTGPTLFAADTPWAKLPLYVNTPSDLARSGASEMIVELTHHTSLEPARTALVESLRRQGPPEIFPDPLASTTRMWADGPMSRASRERRALAGQVELYRVAR